MADAVKVLSIDGGGIRGVIPALVLAEFERRLSAPIAEVFDLIAVAHVEDLLAVAEFDAGFVPATTGKDCPERRQQSKASQFQKRPMHCLN